ncbi:TRAP transporter small permease subunit [Pseudorhodobacter aquimaris]|uniref:TRAP transporter small permease subunit n=1 Tax=Pseudorhodobacter aquimaris TaxID=687412 RepID=UPI00067D71B0|nr:TRAP transporter small permease subunit [Pseudorhodobacter aquimaris]
MKNLFLAIADGISLVLGYIAQAMVLILIGSMLYEVVARYAFGAPTEWAFDIAYMSTGVLFVLGAAQALREDAHVRIDFLAAKFPVRLRAGIDGVIYLFILCPVFAKLATIAGTRSWRAFVTAEVEHVSPWAPLMWPFYTALTVGLAALALQIAAEGIRALLGPRVETTFKIET